MDKSKITFAGFILALSICLASCGGNNQSQQVFDKEMQVSELNQATNPLKDGHYKAEWTYKGQWYAVEYELQDEAVRSARFIEQGATYELKCKLAHKEYIKALRLDKDESEFYFQFNINDLTGYMNYPARHDIQVTIYELPN